MYDTCIKEQYRYTVGQQFVLCGPFKYLKIMNFIDQKEQIKISVH